MNSNFNKIICFGFCFSFPLIFFMGELIVLFISLLIIFQAWSFANRAFIFRNVVFGASAEVFRNSLILISLIFTAVFFMKLLSAVWALTPPQAIGNAFNHIQFLVWPLLLCYMLRVNISIFKAEPYIALSLVVMFAWYSGLILFFPNSSQRQCFAAGAHSCGLLDLSLAFMLSWMALVFSRSNQTLLWRNVSALSFALGFLVLLGTGRKTSLIGLFLAIILIYLLRIRGKFKLLPTVIFISFLSILIGFATYSVGVRFTELFVEMKAYSVGGEARKNTMNTSSGARLEMYKIATKAFRERPLLGWGGGIRPKNIPQFATDPSNPPPYSNFHNQIFQMVLEIGALGAIFLFLLFLYIIKKTIFDAYQAATREYVFLLSALYLAYIVKSFTGLSFGYSHTNTVFVFFSAWLCANIFTINYHPEEYKVI